MSIIEPFRHEHSPGVWFGGDYNPEQWPLTVLDEDMRLMRQAHVNTATVGVFSWSSLEPESGRYEFGWLDEAMDRLHASGVRVILATPTASPPPWFTRLHPHALPVTADGVRLIHGSRDTYNPAAPAYRDAAVRITRALAERYGEHPALAMWHLHNEYGTVSHGPVTDQAFRTWLARRYASLTTLNEAWNTAFWSQGYADWRDVHAPQATQYLANPSHVLDFKRFSADLLLECLRDQATVVRELTPHVPTTTNFMLPTWNHYDQWAFAREIDMVSIDHYLDDAGPAGETHVAFGADLARSFAGGRPSSGAPTRGGRRRRPPCRRTMSPSSRASAPCTPRCGSSGSWLTWSRPTATSRATTWCWSPVSWRSATPGRRRSPPEDAS